jgi:hypothetical protein
MVDGVDEADSAVKFSQKQCSCIRGKAAAVEIGLDFFAAEA